MWQFRDFQIFGRCLISGFLENQSKKNTFLSINETNSNQQCLQTSQSNFYYHLDHPIHFRLHIVS